jgi:hypothetical protein
LAPMERWRMSTSGKNRIMIYGPKYDGTYVVEFRTAEGESLAISVRRQRFLDRRHPNLREILAHPV